MQLQTVIPNVFNQIQPGATMLAVREYTNNYDEVSDFSIVFHIDYLNAVKRSLQIINALQPKSILEEVARRELIESYLETLSGQGNSRDTNSHAYEPIKDGTGTIVKGVRWHSNYTRIYLYGLLVWKKILSPGQYKETNRAPLTIVKDSLRRLTPVDRFRQFILIQDRFKSIGVVKMTLTDQDLINKI